LFGIHGLMFWYWCFRSRNEGVHRDLIAQHLQISLEKLMSLSFSYLCLSHIIQILLILIEFPLQAGYQKSYRWRCRLWNHSWSL